MRQVVFIQLPRFFAAAFLAIFLVGHPGCQQKPQEAVSEFHRVESQFYYRDPDSLGTGYVVELRYPLITDLDIDYYLHLLPRAEIIYLDLSGSRITDNGLQHIKNLTNLRRLDLGNTNITDKGLQHLSNLKKLRLLELENTQVIGMGLKYLQSLPHLQHINLGGTKVTDSGLESIKTVHQIKSLSVRNTAISDHGLKYIAELPQLESISLGSMVSDVGIKYFQKSRKLKKLVIRGSIVTDYEVQKLKQTLSGLKIIDYRTSKDKLQLSEKLTEKQSIKKIEKLKGWVTVNESISDKPMITVCLYAPPSTDNSPLMLLAPLKQVQELQLAGGWINDAELQDLSRLNQLHSLSLRAERWRDREQRQKIYSVGSAYLPEYRDTYVSDTGLKTIGKFTQLESLDLTGTYATDKGLRFLNQLVNLRELGLRNAVVTGEGLKYLESLKELQAIDLSNTVVDDDALEQLEAFPKLKKLWLERTLVTDAGMKKLQKLKNLELLDLQHTAITDAGLKAIKVMKNLKEIKLDYALVTEKGIDSLRKANPTLKIKAEIIGDRAPRATDDELSERYAPFH